LQTEIDRETIPANGCEDIAQNLRAGGRSSLIAIRREFQPAETPQDVLGPAYSTEVTLPNGKRLNALLLPFANIGRWWGTEAEKRVLLPSLGTSTQASDANNSDPAGYRQGAEIGAKNHPYAIWVKPA
jgi:hypothetical protein